MSVLDIKFLKIKVDLPNGRKLLNLDQWEIPFGRHLLIQGESGKGKTTLLHLIAGLFRPQSGILQIGPHSLNDLSDNELCDLRREKIGVVFQKLNLIDHLTVRENLALISSHEAGKIESVLRRVGLFERADERCSVLSLGEQQRVAVARVLVQEPQVILADEPTSSLDARNARFVIEALKEAARGKTLIVVSHDERLSEFFDEVISFEELTQ